MKTQTYKTQENVVKDLRKIRDEISNEIKDMTFKQERAYLDKLLAGKIEPLHKNKTAESEIGK